MSSYKKITRHPATGQYENAFWIDDYFKPHVYGVKFSDGKVYPVEYVKEAQLDHFWADDVLAAVRAWLPQPNDARAFDSEEDAVLDFLDKLNEAYAKRWEDDPLYGGGAYLPDPEVL